jgi:hypothetical protein
MRLFLISVLIQISYKLFTGRLRWFIYGHTSSLWSSGNLWIPDAIVWWRSFRLFSARVAGCTLDALKMSLRFSLLSSFFLWLIYAATLIDPWAGYNKCFTGCFDTFNYASIKTVVCIFQMRLGHLAPISIKKTRLKHISWESWRRGARSTRPSRQAGTIDCSPSSAQPAPSPTAAYHTPLSGRLFSVQSSVSQQGPALLIFFPFWK